jgi:hypothetical protein
MLQRITSRGSSLGFGKEESSQISCMLMIPKVTEKRSDTPYNIKIKYSSKIRVLV